MMDLDESYQSQVLKSYQVVPYTDIYSESIPFTYTKPTTRTSKPARCDWPIQKSSQSKTTNFVLLILSLGGALILTNTRRWFLKTRNGPCVIAGYLCEDMEMTFFPDAIAGFSPGSNDV